LNIPADSTAVLAVTFAGHITPGPTYRLALRLQPLAYGPVASVSVEPTSGWGLGDPPIWQASSREVQMHTWQFGRS
jgi:hypothetical protein